MRDINENGKYTTRLSTLLTKFEEHLQLAAYLLIPLALDVRASSLALVLSFFQFLCFAILITGSEMSGDRRKKPTNLARAF